ncbi:MAG: tetratricopeptide repeat protein, partial [Candidatus Omnitrophota bacterium]
PPVEVERSSASIPSHSDPMNEQLEPSGPLRLTFWGTAVCGMCALAFEVLWTRGLSISLGTTTYSFTIMLAAFLSGIAFGGMIHAVLPLKKISVAVQFCVILLLIGSVGLAVSQLIPHVPQLSLVLNQQLYGHLEGVRPLTTLAVSYLIMLVPAILFGVAFPVAARARTQLRHGVGRSVGDCVGLNTFGAIAGALLAGFVLIPTLGLQRSMMWICVFLMAYGIWIIGLLLQSRINHRWLAWLACLVGWMAIVSLPGKMSGWDYHVLGAFRNNAGEAFIPSQGDIDVKRGLVYSSLIYYREGKGSTVSVTQSSKQRSLLINGKSVATDSFRDIGLEKLMGHIPCLLHTHPQSALVVGLGAGVTLGAVSIHPSIKNVQLVEIEPAVLDASRKFDYINNNALECTKLSVEIQDGRNYLLTTNKTFDIITADPIHPWAAGSTYLYTTEYYRIAQSRLNPGGIMCQWLPLYELSRNNVKSVVRTFIEVFDHCLLWQTNLDTIMVGSQEPIFLDMERIEEQILYPTVTEDLLKIDIADAMSFLALFVTDTIGMRQFSGDAILNTDDNLYLEFSSPHNVGGKTTGTNLYEIGKYRSAPTYLLHHLPSGDESESFAMRWKEYQQVEYNLLVADLLTISAGRSEAPECFPHTISELERLLARLPDYGRTRHLLSIHELSCGMFYSHHNQPETAMSHLHRALDHYPNNARAHCEMAEILANQNRMAEALEQANVAVALNPILAEGWIRLGSLHESEGNYQQAEENYQQALKVREGFSLAYYHLGILAAKNRNPNQALYYFEQALEENPKFTDALFGQASILFQQQEFDPARKLFEKIIGIDPNYAKAQCGMGMYWQMMGNFDEAIRFYQKAIQISPDFALAQYNLATAFYAIGNRIEAKSHLDEAERLGHPVPAEFRQTISETPLEQ